MRSVHLLVTGLAPDFGPNSSAMLSGLDVPGQRRFQARGRVVAAHDGEHPPGLSRRLAALFGLPVAQGLPLAPLRLALDGVDPGESPWFCADPVHLLLMLDHLRMGATPPISAEESAALVSWLNQNFVGEAEFIAPTPEHWYVRFNRPVQARTTPPDEFGGESIEPHLPTGEDSKYLRRLNNEIQMLLHAHPLREAREERGEAVLNSLWIWGGGVRSAPVGSFERVFSDEAISRAMAHAGRIPWQSLTTFCSDSARNSFEPGKSLIVINALHPYASQGDLAAWKRLVEQLDQSCLVPLYEALKRGRLDEIVFESVGKGGLIRRLSRWDTWKFWKG